MTREDNVIFAPSWVANLLMPMYPLEAIRGDILELERETDGLFADILGR